MTQERESRAMFLKQVANDSTGCVSYVGYCYSCKAGFVIDPLEDIEPYLQVAKKIVALVLRTFSIPISKQTI
jgi:hypothetical protein